MEIADDGHDGDDVVIISGDEEQCHPFNDEYNSGVYTDIQQTQHLENRATINSTHKRHRSSVRPCPLSGLDTIHT